MSNTLVYSGVSRKTLAIIAITVGVLFVALIGIRYAAAVAPSDYGLHEGDTVSAAGSDDPDVYIVNELGYKRLFLNPVIFGFYGHLGGFANVKSITPATRDAFPTSGLFRVDGTEKVYGVESTGEDTGVLHWVNTTGAQAVADDPNFFKKVFVINQTEFNWYSQGTAYTSVSQVPSYARVPGQAPGVPGAVTVSLASDNPGASTITKGANGVTYLKLNLVGTGTVNSLRVKRGGPGKTTDFSNIYVYDGAKRLTSGRSLSASDGATTFSNLSIAVSGSKVISIVADMTCTGASCVTTSATAGDVNYFIVGSGDITLSSGTVGGSFPINGSNFTVSGAAGGSVTITNSGSIGSPNVGQTHVEIAEFKLAASTEAAKVSRVQLIQGGTVKMADLSNLTLEVLGTKVADGTTLSTGYIVFDMLSSPYTIAKGDNRIFKVYADVQGKKAETLIFYLEVTSDLLAVGDQYGFGMNITNTYAVANAQTLTLQGGVLTLSFVGPTATNISTTTSKTHLLDFDINAAANVELRQHVIILCKDDLGDGTYADASSATSGWADIEAVGIIDRDTGVTLVGTVDGSSFTNTTYDDADDGCPDGATGAPYLFTDTVSFNAGETKHLAVVGDIKTANSTDAAAGDIVSTDVIKVVLYGYGTQAGTSGSLTVAKYSNTNVALTSSDIVPSGNITGNNMTVQGSTLTLALAATPATGAHSFVKNTKNVTANGFSFSTALGNTVTLTAVTLSGYVSDSWTTDAAGTADMNLGIGSRVGDTTLSVSSLVSAVRLVDGETGAVLATGPTTNNLMNATGTAAFSNLNWVIPGGATKTMLVQVDLANYTSGTDDVFAFDIAATGNVTAVDQNSNTINLTAANEDVNGAGAATVTWVKTNSAGTLTLAAAADSPTSAPVYWGQSDAAFSKFKFTSTNEGFFIERLYMTTDSTTALVNNVDRVKVSYTNKAGSPLTQIATPNSGATISFSFEGDARPYVPKDGSTYMSVSANMKTAATLFRATGSDFSIDIAGTGAVDLRAVGEGSSAVITGTTTGSGGATSSATPGQDMYVYRSFPQFTILTAPATTIAIGQDVFKFKIDAMGLNSDGATVFMNGLTSDASGSLRFAVYASGALYNGSSSPSLGFDLRRIVDADNLTVDQLVASRTLVTSLAGNDSCVPANCAMNFGVPGKAASATFAFQDVSTNQSVEIPAGKSNTFVLRLNAVTGFSKPYNATLGIPAHYLQIVLRGVADNAGNTGNVKWTDSGGVNRDGDEINVANILKNLPMTGTRLNFQ